MIELVVVYGVFWVLLGWGESWVTVRYGRGDLVLVFFF